MLFMIGSDGKPEKYVAERMVLKRAEAEYTVFDDEGGLQGVVSSKGDTLVAPIEGKVLNRFGEEFRVTVSQGMGLVNANHQLIVPCVWDHIIVLGPEVFLVRRNSKYGLLRRDGTWLRPMD